MTNTKKGYSVKKGYYKGIQIRFSEKEEERCGSGWYAVLPTKPFSKVGLLYKTYEDLISAIDSNKNMYWH